MGHYRITKGRDIRIKGAAQKQLVDIALPKQVAIQPQDFKGLKARLCVKVDDTVKVGSPVFKDKTNEKIFVASPVSGKVVAINRGNKRALLEIVVETDGKQDAQTVQSFSEGDISNLSKDQVTDHLLTGGLWPVLRQRPFASVANPEQSPKSIFVHAVNTEPLAPDVDFVLEGREKEFQTGLNILGKLTEGNVYLCAKQGASSAALSSSQNVETHTFSGPHPSGNVSTHIHYIDPIKKGDVVWYVEAQDVLRVAELFLKGINSPERIVAITGEGAKNCVYAKTVIGAPVSALLQGSDLQGMRCISGSVLSGKKIGDHGFVCYYDAQVTVIPEGGERKLIGWLLPGFKSHTFTHMFASSFLPKGEASVDADENGSHRAIVLNHLYDKYVALDIMTYFLLKAILSGDIEEAEKLGILECDEEDFALCTFACPSKFDVGAVIRGGLDTIEREG